MKPGVSALQSWQPSVLQEEGALLRHRGTQVDDAGGDVSTAFTTLSGSWSGLAADAARSAGSTRTTQLSDLAELMDLAGGVLLRAGDDLQREKDALTRLLDDAASHGCTVADDGTVSPPPMPTMPAGLSEDDAADWRSDAQQQGDDDADVAASLTTRIQACLTAAGEIDDSAAAALNSAHASASPAGTPGGGISLGSLDDYQPMDGVTAPQALLKDFSLIDTDGNGKIDRDDLEAAVANEALPSDLRDAAQYLLDNPTLYDHAEEVTQGNGQTDGTLSRDDLLVFTAMQPRLMTLAQSFRSLDTADEGGDPDSHVSKDDLEAAAGNTTLPLAVRAAAQWFLDHPKQLQILGATQPSTWGDGQGFRYDDLVSRAIDDQVFTHDPKAAADFVNSLPFPDPGDKGLKVGIVSDDGFRSIANASLLHAGGDLTETHSIISHLPETDSGQRNNLITASYVDLSQRMDQLLSGPLAGHPDYPGHPGANWMVYAPWASNGVHDAITGDFSVFGIHPSESQRQAAADGNQWIYGDIGAKYASFLEFYDEHPNPTPEQLQTYFADSYGAGDRQMQTGMAAYSELMTTDDPVRRQELAYQGNVLIAVHEQNGAQPWLERIASPGPDSFISRYIDIQMGHDTINVDQDVDPLDSSLTGNNLLIGQDFRDLDPGNATASDIAPTALGHGQLPAISGEETRDGDFPVTLSEMADKGGTYSAPYPYPVGGSPFPVQVLEHADPNTQTASGAESWTDPGERMYMLAKLFEQEHASPDLFQPQDLIHVGYGSDDNAWLDPRTGLR